EGIVGSAGSRIETSLASIGKNEESGSPFHFRVSLDAICQTPEVLLREKVTCAVGMVLRWPSAVYDMVSAQITVTASPEMMGLVQASYRSSYAFILESENICLSASSCCLLMPGQAFLTSPTN